MPNYKSAAETREIFKITSQTLNNWRRNGQIKYNQINSRNILYDIDSVNSFAPEKSPRINIVYSRVSQAKQKEDLKKQTQILVDYANANGYKTDKIYEEIASGMNENRRKLNEVIDLVVNNRVNKVFITYKDRLTRFGFGYFESVFKRFNTEIVVLNEENTTTFEEEMVQDLVSIIRYFSMKMYSNRRRLLKKVQKEIENEYK